MCRSTRRSSESRKHGQRCGAVTRTRRPRYFCLNLAFACAVKRRWSTAGKDPPGNWFAPPGSNGSSSGGNEAAEAYSPQTGRAYLGTVPAKKRVIRICEAISSETGRNKTLLDQQTVVGTLNRMMIGWAHYFCLGPVSKAYRAVEQHARKRLRQWLCAKHKVAWPATKRFPDADLHEVLGLVRLTARTRSFPWATS
jgi:hypothetical protein